MEQGPSQDRWFLVPQQHGTYEQYIQTKVEEARRMHKRAVQAKINREELWERANDPYKYLTSYEKMK